VQTCVCCVCISRCCSVYQVCYCVVCGVGAVLCSVYLLCCCVDVVLVRGSVAGGVCVCALAAQVHVK